MGDLIKAICSCGYESEQMKQGIGFQYFDTGVFYEPAYCDNCGIIEEKEGSDKIPECVTCKGELIYYKSEVKVPETDEFKGMPNTEYLNKKKYWHCPKCKKRRLKFMHEGMWD